MPTNFVTTFRQLFRGWQGAIADHLSTGAAAQGSLPDGRLERGGEGSYREWIPDRAAGRLRQADHAPSLHRDGSRPRGAPHVLSGVPREREKFDAVRGAEDRRDDRDRGGHGSGQGHDSDVRLRGHFEGA